MPKTIFVADGDIEKIIDYQFALKLNLDDGSYTLTTFRNQWTAYYEMNQARPGPDLLITAFKFGRSPEMDGSTLIRQVHKLGSQTKFILSDAMHESDARPVLDGLKRDGIDVKYIPYSSVESDLSSLVKSLIGE